MSSRAFFRAVVAAVCAAGAFFIALGLVAALARAQDIGADLPVEPGEIAVVKTATAAPVKASSGPHVVVVPPYAPPEPLAPKAPLPPVEVPPQIYGKDLATANGTIVYVLDFSGSMAAITPDGKTRVVKMRAEVSRSVAALPKSIKFGLLAYDCTYLEWRAALEPATDLNKADAQAWLAQREPNGATGTGPAMYYALALRFPTAKLVVLLTDGAPNCGAGDGMGGPSCLAAHRSQITSGNTGRHARVDVFGIEASGEYRAWCIAVAAENGGSYADVK